MPLGFRTQEGDLELEGPERAARRMIRAELNLAVHRRRQVAWLWCIILMPFSYAFLLSLWLFSPADMLLT